MHVEIELFGGPEDGRELTLPIGTDGEPLSPLPVPSTHLHEASRENLTGRSSSGDGEAGDLDDEKTAEANTASDQEVAWYEKYYRRNNAWIYKYTTAQTVRSN